MKHPDKETPAEDHMEGKGAEMREMMRVGAPRNKSTRSKARSSGRKNQKR